MSSGFIEFDSNYAGGVDLSGASSGHVKILMQKPSGTTSTKWFQGLPTGMVKWSHLELILSNGTTAGAYSGNLSKGATGPFLSWDTDGFQIAAGPTQGSGNIELVQRVNGSEHLAMVTLTFDVVPTTPFDTGGNVESDKIYLWIKPSGTVTHLHCIRARLYWNQLGKG